MADVQLNDSDQAFVDELVENRIYENADDAVRAGLRLLGSGEGQLAELRRQIQEGIDDIEAGRVLEFNTADELKRHILNLVEDRKNASTQTENVNARASRSGGDL